MSVRTWRGLVAVALLAIAAGCNDDEGATPAATGPANAGEPASAEADLAIAEDVNLWIEDLPPTWEAGPVDLSSDDEAAEPEIAKCVGPGQEDPDGGNDDDNPAATSPTFESPFGERVTSRVAVAPSAARLSQRLDELGTDAMTECMGHSLATGIAEQVATSDDTAEGLVIGEPTIDRLAADELGDQSVTFRITIPLTYHGTETAVYTDIVAVRVGRVGITLSFDGFGSRFDPDHAEELTALLIERARASDAGRG